MTTITTPQSTLHAALLEAAAVLQTLAVQFRTVLRRFNAHWEARARAAVAIRELNSLSDRDLRDMGLSRGDVPRLVEEERNWRRG